MEFSNGLQDIVVQSYKDAGVGSEGETEMSVDVIGLLTFVFDKLVQCFGNRSERAVTRKKARAQSIMRQGGRRSFAWAMRSVRQQHPDMEWDEQESLAEELVDNWKHAPQKYYDELFDKAKRSSGGTRPGVV
jgi:undecaprenyl pyrophosphate synthase